MSVLYIIIHVLQFCILLTVTGILIGVVAASRLMEIAITVIHPVTVFVLRQSANLILCSACRSATLMVVVIHKLCGTGHLDWKGDPRTRRQWVNGRLIESEFCDQQCSEDDGDNVPTDSANSPLTNQMDRDDILSGAWYKVKRSDTKQSNISKRKYDSRCGLSNKLSTYVRRNGWFKEKLYTSIKAKMDLEVVLADLNTKVPCLQEILRPEYMPYLNTACTVLLGWLIVCWLSHTIWTLLAPLTVSAVAIVLICPTTVKWCIKQFLPNLENALHDTIAKFNLSMPDRG